MKQLILATLFIALAVLSPIPQARAATFTVNVTDDENDGTCDSTHCSLREAISAANTAAGTDTISFDIPGAGVHTIQPTAALPTITQPVIIDGTTQPGYSDYPLIELDGSAAGAGVNGLTIFAGSSTVKGLVINRFTFAGIFLGLGGGNTIAGNFIGTNAAGSGAAGNRDGVYLLQSHNNTIGGATPGAGNLISGNWDDGINPNTANGTIIQGNFIGTDAAGTSAVGNSGDGIKIDAQSNNTRIGGDDGANVIAYNLGRGVYMEINGGNYGVGNQVLGNAIFGNGGLGIDLGGDGVTANDAGDADTGPNNLQNFPVLTSAYTALNVFMAAGTLNSEADLAYRVEFFANDVCDPSGNGEGQTFLGWTAAMTDDSGDAAFNVDLAVHVEAGKFITATATSLDNDTSEFSACLEVAAAAPANASPTRNYFTTNTPTLTWNPITWAIGYEVQIATAPDFSAIVRDKTDLDAADLAWVVDGSPALSDDLYYWRVRARRTAVEWGAWSSADAFWVDTP